MSKKPIPVATLDPDQCYASPDEAALAVLRKLPPKVTETAYAIYKTQGPEAALRFCASVPIQGVADSFQFKTQKGQELAGLVHTHAEGNRFSDNDVATAEALRVLSFIRDDQSGDVKRFEPGVSRVTNGTRHGSRSERRRSADGTLIGNTRREQLEAAYDLHNPPTKP